MSVTTVIITIRMVIFIRIKNSKVCNGSMPTSQLSWISVFDCPIELPVDSIREKFN